MKTRAGFSLLELMVVIGLIALLTAIAVPFYADYANKSKIALAAVVLNEFNNEAMALYNEGAFTTGSTDLTIKGLAFTDNGVTAYTQYPVAGLQMLFPGDGYMNDSEWMFCAFVSDLSFDGYTGPFGPNSRLCQKVVVDNGVYTTHCGIWTSVNNGIELPAQYLPDQCNDPEISMY